MTSWLARTSVMAACVAAGVASGWKVAGEFPVRFQGTVRVSVPYETTRGVDPASLPMQETLERSAVEPTAEWLASVVDRSKSVPGAIEPEGPFESEIDHLRRTLSVRIERQAGQDDYVIEHRSARIDAARGVLKVAGDACLEAFLRLHERRMEERNAPLRKELEEWQAKVAAAETEAAKVGTEIAATTPGEAGRETARERARLLSAAIAEARKVRLEAENRFAGAREDISAGRPVETVLARLPEGPLRATLTRTIDGRDRLTELRELSRELESLSELYGPKHPRIARVKQRLADLASTNSSARTPVRSRRPRVNCCWRRSKRIGAKSWRPSRIWPNNFRWTKRGFAHSTRYKPAWLPPNGVWAKRARRSAPLPRGATARRRVMPTKRQESWKGRRSLTHRSPGPCGNGSAPVPPAARCADSCCSGRLAAERGNTLPKRVPPLPRRPVHRRKWWPPAGLSAWGDCGDCSPAVGRSPPPRDRSGFKPPCPASPHRLFPRFSRRQPGLATAFGEWHHRR